MNHVKAQQTNRKTLRFASLGFKKMGSILIIFLLMTPALFAAMGTTSFDEPMITQESGSEVSDQELLRFGVALVEVQELQLEANQEINQSIANADISPERLDEIFIMQQEAPDKLEQEVSREEIREFNQVMTTISVIHQEVESEIVTSLEDHAFDIESFNHMAAKIQEDPDLLNRLQVIFSEQQEGI